MKNPSKTLARSFFAFALAALIALLPASRLAAQAPVPDSPAIEAKAQALLAKLTLEEKIKLLGGVDSMYTQTVPSIGLPRFKMSDASVGVRTWGPTTAYAGGVALAATWDKDFARSLGTALGRDARARGVHCCYLEIIFRGRAKSGDRRRGAADPGHLSPGTADTGHAILHGVAGRRVMGAVDRRRRPGDGDARRGERQQRPRREARGHVWRGGRRGRARGG